MNESKPTCGWNEAAPYRPPDAMTKERTPGAMNYIVSRYEAWGTVLLKCRIKLQEAALAEIVDDLETMKTELANRENQEP